jgi:hypothetical protein
VICQHAKGLKRKSQIDFLPSLFMMFIHPFDRAIHFFSSQEKRVDEGKYTAPPVIVKKKNTK